MIIFKKMYFLLHNTVFQYFCAPSNNTTDDMHLTNDSQTLSHGIYVKNLANMSMKWTNLMINVVSGQFKKPLILLQKGYVSHCFFICVCVIIQHSGGECDFLTGIILLYFNPFVFYFRVYMNHY